MAENRIKSLTGGDKITVNFMRQISFEFMPQLKLTIVGNNAPSLTNVDKAIRRRFIILPFDNIPGSKDPNLPEKLRGEWSGILSWMIEGWLDWQASGLIRPEVAERATQAYFEVLDVFAQWIEDFCETGAVADTTASRRRAIGRTGLHGTGDHGDYAPHHQQGSHQIHLCCVSKDPCRKRASPFLRRTNPG